MSEDNADNFVSELVRDNWNVVIWGRTIDTIIRDIRPVSTHACISFPAHFALNDPSQWIRASSLYSLVFISMFLTWMQLMMLKRSFSSLPSYKYGRFKPNFFCGTNDAEEDAACLETYFLQFVDDFRFQDSASRVTILVLRASFRLVWSRSMLK